MVANKMFVPTSGRAARSGVHVTMGPPPAQGVLVWIGKAERSRFHVVWSPVPVALMLGEIREGECIRISKR